MLPPTALNKLRKDTLRWATRNDRRDMVPAIIHAMRFLDPGGRAQLGAALRSLTGARYGDSWFDWMLWLQTHPEAAPFAGFDAFLK